MLKRAMAICILVPCAVGLVWGQSVGNKDPRALTLLSATLSALVSGVNVTNVALTGTVTRTAGSDVENGSATLEALGWAESRIDISLTNGQWTEIMNQSQGAPTGQWSGADGTAHAMATHNSLVPASWFFPVFVLAGALNDPAVTVTYIGQETRNGETVQHLKFWHVLRGESGSADSLAQFHALSTADVYLNATSSLPVELDFNIHPDRSATVDIPIEIQYSGYQKMSGILLPTHIQKRINHSLFLDLNVTGATINTSLSPSDFAITATSK